MFLGKQDRDQRGPSAREAGGDQSPPPNISRGHSVAASLAFGDCVASSPGGEIHKVRIARKLKMGSA